MEEKWKAHGTVLKFETPGRHFHGDAARLDLEVYRFGRRGLIAGIESRTPGRILQGVEWRWKRCRGARTELCDSDVGASGRGSRAARRWEEAQGQREETVWRREY